MHRNVALRVLAALVGLAGLVLLAPTVPAAAHGLTHITHIGDDDAAEHGTVTVAGCRRAALDLGWQCTGRFAVDDPIAEPFPAESGVTVVNDGHRHAAGQLVDVSMQRGAHRAYRYGTTAQLRTIATWLAVLLCLGLVGGAVSGGSRGRATSAATATPATGRPGG